MSSNQEKDFVDKEVDMADLLADENASDGSKRRPTTRNKQLNRLRKAAETKPTENADLPDEDDGESDSSELEGGFGRFQMRDENEAADQNSASKKKKGAKGAQAAGSNKKIDQFTKSGPKKPTKGTDEDTARYLEQQEEKRRAKKKRDDDDDWNLQGMNLEKLKDSDDEFATERSEDSDEQLLRALEESRKLAEAGASGQKNEIKPRTVSGNKEKKGSKGKKKEEDDDLDGFVADDEESVDLPKPNKVSGSTARTSRSTKPNSSKTQVDAFQQNLEQYGDVANMDPEAVEALFVAIEEEQKELVRNGGSNKKSTDKKPMVIPPKGNKKKRVVSSSDEDDFDLDEDSDDGMMIEEKKPTRKTQPAPKSASKPKQVKTKPTKMDDDDDEQGTGVEIKGILSGQNIVFTGMFASTGGDNKGPLLEVVKTLGGRCPSSVSKKTSILVGGYQLPDGRPTNTSGKYQDAVDKGVKIMTEDEFEEFLKEKTGMSVQELIEGGAAQFAKTGAATAVTNKMDEEKRPGQNMMDEEAQGARIQPEETNASKNELWTDKYAPKTLEDIIGNQGLINKLRVWLLDWEDVVIHGNKKEIKGSRAAFNPNAFAQENVNARAAMLSGSPGIGKTTTVRLLCKELGLNLIEQNASDVRNKKLLQGSLGTLTTTSSLNYSGDAGKSVILMDEVDGMTSDRGGTSALNEYIKKTRVPIICVCNDRSNPKMRTLAGNCYDLRYMRPSRPQVAQWLLKIIKREVRKG